MANKSKRHILIKMFVQILEKYLELGVGVAKLKNCLTDIYTWMSQDKLKLNADKT